MNPTLNTGIIQEILEPFTFRVRLDDGREVVAIPSRFHFEHTAQDMEEVQALRRGIAVTVRVSDQNSAAGWLVRVAQTAQEWRKGTSPTRLLETVRDTADERKLRFFVCACCRQVATYIPPGPHQKLLEVLEAHAKGQATAAALQAAKAAGDAEENYFADAVEECENDPVRGPEMGSTAKAIWAVRIAANPVQGARFFEIALDAARCCVEARGLRAKAQAASRLGATVERVEVERSRAEETAFRSQADLVRELFSERFQPMLAPVLR